MTGELTIDYSRLRYIELRGDGSKLPAKSWGGYSQDFSEAEHVYTHDDVMTHPSDNWGIVDVEDQQHDSLALLIFDIDVHKAPDEFDPDRVGVPADTLVTRSQNGGFHVYFVISGCQRGQLNESDFQMTSDPGFDVDIRGSAVSHHVVAPADFPGVGGDYTIVNDDSLCTYFEPAQAAERVTLDGEPLLEFNPDSTGVNYDFDVPSDPPEDMPTCYHAGLELRKAAPDDHPNTHKVNMLTAACGLGAGYSPETVAGHFCGEWAPVDGEVDLSDKEATEYQVGQIERTGYSPPSEQTLRDYGILGDGEHCDEGCPIEYHGPHDKSRPQLDVVAELGEDREAAAEAAAVAGEPETAQTDGGATAETAASSSRISFQDRVRNAIAEFQDDDIQAKTARHRIAEAFTREWHFVAPEREVRGWRDTLYVFNDDEGVYEPRGEAFIEKQLEHVAYDFTTNQTKNEIVDKIRRMSIARGERFQADPHRLVVGNGILNLHTGELDDYSPFEYHRTKIDIDWNPDAGEPHHIDDFLHDVVRGRDVDTLYRLIAHTLYKEYVGEKAAMLIGSGQNGKSVFLSFVEAFLGEYNTSHRSLQDFEDQFAANQLEGKLANIHPDMGDSAVKDLSTFKKLTGRDTMLADVKYETPIQFENFATMIFAANEMPVFGEDNHAVWRRWVYVDFPYTFRADLPNAKDPEPKSQIMRRLTSDQQLEALLVRCQQEIERWHNGEDWYPDAMEPEAVREQMKKAAEPVYDFAMTCLRESDDDDAFLPKDQVRNCYREYATAEGLPKMGKEQFGQRLMNLQDLSLEDGRRRKNNAGYTYEGVEFTQRARQLLGLDGSDDEQQSTVDETTSDKQRVHNILREMVAENNNDPVPEDMLVGNAMAHMGMSKARHVIDELKSSGRICEVDGKLYDN